MGYVLKRTKQEPTDSYFYLARHISKCMMRSDAFNFHVEPIRTKVTGMQQIPISNVFFGTRANQKGSPQTKSYRKFFLRMTDNQRALSLMKVLQRRANNKAFTKVSLKISKNMQLIKQNMRNLWLQITQSSTS